MAQDGKNSSSILKPARFGAAKGESSGASSSILTPSRLAGNPFLAKFNSPDVDADNSGSILRPSAFDSAKDNASKGTGLLKPATLHNPFLAASSEKTSYSSSSNGHEDKTTSSTNYFTQFADAGQSSSSSSSEKKEADTGGTFVFGQNLADRVTGAQKSDTAEPKAEEEVEPEKGDDDVSKSSDSKETASPSTENKSMTLKESAEAYQARHKQQTYDEVEVITGEEGESNVLKVSCCLYVLDKRNQTWTERGRGILHLNDKTLEPSGSLQSRLVMRLQGSMKVVLNASLWSEMMIDRAGDRSVRITAPDPDGDLRIMLIKASPGHAEQLCQAIRMRVVQLRAAENDNKKSEAEQTTAGDRTEVTAGVKRSAEDDDDDNSKKTKLDPVNQNDSCSEKSKNSDNKESGEQDEKDNS